jgi:hypothetical protein
MAEHVIRGTRATAPLPNHEMASYAEALLPSTAIDVASRPSDGDNTFGGLQL